jgi:hypothetical protein
MKHITIAAKPSGSNRQSAEDWVADKNTGEPTKRLTIDVTARLHTRIKSQCATRGQNMADELRKLLESNYPEEYEQKQGEGAATMPVPGNTTL